MTVARGGKRGKTSGRGTKGQKSRAGHKIRPEIRDMIKKLPKLRGYAFNSLQTRPFVVNVGDLNDKFDAGASVSMVTLAAKKMIPESKGKTILVKILGGGELAKKLVISGLPVSASAKTKIEKVGGTIEA